MAVSHTISTETTITYHDRYLESTDDLIDKIQNLAMNIGGYVHKHSPEPLSIEQQRNLNGFMSVAERDSMIQWSLLPPEKKTDALLTDIMHQYKPTEAKISALMRFINNSNFFIVMSNKFCDREGDGIPCLVQTVTIESTDSALISINQQKLKALMLTSSTTSVKIGAVSQAAWNCLTRYVNSQRAIVPAPRNGYVPPNVPRVCYCVIS